MCIIRRIVSLVLVLCLVSSFCIPALADTWYLDDGDISIGFQEDDKQYVTQNEESKQDDAPVITSREETSHTIEVSSGEGQTAQFTVQDLNVTTDQNTSAIEIADGSTVEMTVSGTNQVHTEKKGKTGSAASIHVGNADLTIQDNGGENDSLTVNSDSYLSSNGAAIGSDNGEAFAGSIHITGDVTVNASGRYMAAAIGSGKSGDFSGSVSITDGATVAADSNNDSAAIGGGKYGDFNGQITIKDSSVTATSYNNGAGIGGGYRGDFNGTLEIENADVRARAGNILNASFKGEAAGIGAGYDGDFSGTVRIKDSTVIATALHDGAGIGAGGKDNNSQIPEFSGTLIIDNSNVTAETGDRGTPIGAPEVTGVFNGGTIEVKGNSVLTLVDGQNTQMGEQALIGGNDPDSTGTITIEDTVKVNAWSGTVDKTKLDANDRESYHDAIAGGSYTQINAEDLKSITNDSVDVEVIIVPKPVEDESHVDSAVEEEPTETACTQVDSFWINLETRIRAAKTGDQLTVDAQYRTSIPVRILELLAQYGVTLVIQWNGGEDIVIPPDHGIVSEQETIRFSQLLALLEK